MGRATLMAALVAASLAGAARAQDAGATTPEEPKPTVQEQMLLRGRNRSLLHPSDPLKIGGREQDGNDMRAGTTALQRGKISAAGVNGDDTYQRAIAMVENRAVYTRPPTRAPLDDTQVATASRKASSNARRASSTSTDDPPPSSNMPWAIGGIVAATLAVAGWMYVRRRG